MNALVDLLNPDAIVAIGNDAAIGLEKLGLPHVKVRHPSYGGVSDFRRGVSHQYGFADDPGCGKQLTLL